MILPEHLTAIAERSRFAMESLHSFLDVTAGSDGHPLSDELWFEFGRHMDELKETLSLAGCFNGRLLTSPPEERKAYAALRTLADDVQACDLEAAAEGKPPVDVEAFAGRLAGVVKALAPPQTGRPHTRTKVSGKKVKGKRIDERMLSGIRDNSEAVYWSAQQWADNLVCQKSTVAETKTWKTICLPARETKRLSQGKRLRRKKPH
jgi:hypothetical protein